MKCESVICPCCAILLVIHIRTPWELCVGLSSHFFYEVKFWARYIYIPGKIF